MDMNGEYTSLFEFESLKKIDFFANFNRLSVVRMYGTRMSIFDHKVAERVLSCSFFFEKELVAFVQVSGRVGW